MMKQEQMQEAITSLAAARSIVVLTGAGVSKESGIPTFRDALEGLWENYDPQELATPQGFQRNPKLVWQWYASRREKLNEVQPNPAHYALAQLGRLKAVTLITQNVDGLHQKAGSQEVLELHGSLVRYKCFKRNHPISLDLVEGAEEPPACPRCGSLARPDVVWFGEMLPLKTLQKASQVASKCDVMLVVGTSGLVYPAAGLPLSALEAGAITIEVNPDKTVLTPYLDIHLSGRAGSVMPILVEGVAKVLNSAYHKDTD